MGLGGSHPGCRVGSSSGSSAQFGTANSNWNWADSLAAIVLAPACAACGAVLESPIAGSVCGRCWDSIPPAPLSWRTPAGISVDSAGAYDGTLKNIVHAWKFERRQSLARPLAALLVDRCPQALEGCELAVPVPMTPWRKWRRGFNQAEDLASRLGVPVSRALSRWRPRPAQSTLPSSRRRSNLETSVFVPRWRRPAVLGRAVLLVDDVVTTGATIDACAEALGEGGAADVRAVTVARTMLRSSAGPRGGAGL